MISVRHLTLDLQTPDGPRRVLDDVSLDIGDGQLVALMGANGSGKTSLARCLIGIYRPTAGEVFVDGLDTRNEEDRPEIRRRLGMVFQNPDHQIVAPTVEREIAFGLENLGMPRPEMHRRVEAMLKWFRLEAYRQQAPHLLSGGEKQRLAIAAVMAMQPRHLVFDEPTSLLDYESRCQLLALMTQLAASPHAFAAAPLALLLITQFPEEALFAPRLLILDRGWLVMDGPPREIFLRGDELHRLGLQPPIEFLVHQELPNYPIEDFLLTPIL
jgi:energy-coupling factor transport system ATP-binding protein